MKLSVSLPEDDIEFLDAYSRSQGYPSRSAALHQAVAMLRSSQLAGAYEDAWNYWESAGEAGLWDSATADGMGS